MGTDKSILEKLTDTVKDIATLASDAASHALKSDASPPKTDEEVAMYMPLAADGLVSDPMMVPPIVIAPSKKRATKKTARKAAVKTSKKPAAKAKKESAAEKSKPASKKTAKKAAKKTVKKTAKKAVKKSAKKTAKKARKAKR